MMFLELFKGEKLRRDLVKDVIDKITGQVEQESA